VRTAIRTVDPTRPAGWFRRFYARLAATRVSLFISRHLNWYIDPWLLQRTRGRVASTLVFPTGLLETRGARTGAVRRNAIIYFHDSKHHGRVIVAASNGGAARNPSWFHNLAANPEVTFGGIPMRATVIDDAERDRLWVLADNVFPAFARYRRDAAARGRTIPLVALTPVDARGAAAPEP
jgi:deazaflavin-dependent oxidoreductase (nitroreductase family)